MAGKRRWIAYAAGVHGRVVVNDGAREAHAGRQGEPAFVGVVRVEEQFEPQDVSWRSRTCEGREFARGIVNCASARGEGTCRISARSPNAACW